MVVPSAFFPVDNTPEKAKSQGENRQAKADQAQKGQAWRHLPAVGSHHFESHEHLAQALPLPAMQRQKIYRNKQREGKQGQEKTEENGWQQFAPVRRVRPQCRCCRAQAAEIEKVDQEDIDTQGHPPGQKTGVLGAGGGFITHGRVFIPEHRFLGSSRDQECRPLCLPTFEVYR